MKKDYIIAIPDEFDYDWNSLKYKTNADFEPIVIYNNELEVSIEVFGSIKILDTETGISYTNYDNFVKELEEDINSGKVYNGGRFQIIDSNYFEITVRTIDEKGQYHNVDGMTFDDEPYNREELEESLVELFEWAKEEYIMLKLDKLTNEMILKADEDLKYEGICGTEDGILIEESFEMFLRDNKIELVDEDEENGTVKYKQGDIERTVKVLYSLKGLEYLDFGR